MVVRTKALTTLSFALALSTSASAAMAQETTQPEPANVPAVITEDFEGDDTSLMLGGQIEFQTRKSPWVLYVKDGQLVMENRQNPQSLHYNDIAWVKFPGSDVIESTEHLVISVVVDGEVNGNGGAGFIVGSGKEGVYLMFSVDDAGRFHVLQKDGRQLRPVHRATHPAIVLGGPNEISFDVKGAHVAFLANGTEVIQIPFPSRMSVNRQQSGQAGIGLAAFGTGTFFFDDVEIGRDD